MSPTSRVEYPHFIKKLPQANLPVPKAVGHLVTGKTAQVIFFEMPAGTKIPPHSHAAQWGMVVSGELELNIGGDNRIRRPGDSYYIADQVEHSAVVLQDSLVVEVFDDPQRYQEKA